MKLYLAVLIAAVTANCLVTTINGTTVSNTLSIPYTDMLLPPLEDAQASSNDVAAIESLTSDTTDDSTTATTTRITTTTTKTTISTKKPITNDVNNVLPELSIEALLPPLFEAKTEEAAATEEEEIENKQQTEETTTKAKPVATTARTTTTTTAKPSTTTNKPTTKATTLKPSKVEIPSLSLEALLPPLFDNLVDSSETTADKVVKTTTTTTTTTTRKPLHDSAIFKTTKKSYYQQQTQHLKDLHLIDQEAVHPKNYEKQQQQLKNLQTATAAGIKSYNNNKQQQKLKTTAYGNNDRHVAESKTQTHHVALSPSSPPPQHLQRMIEQLTPQHAAQQIAHRTYHSSSSNNNDPKQFNYSFDFYLGTTTPRPHKYGLPTITPFPHRLGR